MRISDWSSDVCSSDLSSSEGAQPQLVLSALVENVTGETQAAAFGYPPRLVTIEADELAFDAPEITLLRDRQPLYQLQPRMPEEVEIIWKTPASWQRSEEHTSELQSLMRNSYAVFCLKKKNKQKQTKTV